MVFNYSLDKDDYLHYLFYSTSKSRKVQKRRSLNKLLLMMIILITGYFLYSKNGPVASAVFFALCLPLYFVYNRFEKKQYQKHFSRFIDTHFTHYLGKPSTLELGDTNFRVVDEEDNTYNYEDIEEINETPRLVIMQMKSGLAVLIPKNKISQETPLMDTIRHKAGVYSVPVHGDTNWNWK